MVFTSSCNVQFHVCFLPIATFKAIMANNNNCKQ
uniref:Uncharacterized protein n=1 Tax=Anguilla anguilla TaxID=7936 RepID=A0A0E9QIX3_ANGAN